MPLSQNRFTMWTHTTFLTHTFGLSTNVPLMLLISTPFTLYVRSTLCIMDNYTVCMWLHETRLLGKVEALFNSSEAWLVEVNVIAIIDTKGT